MNEEYYSKDEMDMKEQAHRIQLIEEQIEESTEKQNLFHSLTTLTNILITVIILSIIFKVLTIIGIVSVSTNGDFIINALRAFYLPFFDVLF